MSSPGPARKRHSTPASGKSKGLKSGGNVHPVIMYPIRHPANPAHLAELYEFIGGLDGDRKRYARPITVMDRKTRLDHGSDPTFQDLINHQVTKHSDLIEAWCVDTCQMWYTGLGTAFDRGKPGDVYWLIPGDFNYSSTPGREVLSHLHDLPEIIEELNQDLCIGEIATSHDNPKQLIDTHGTFALLYTWFPKEAREIRQYTQRPRSEFFAIRHSFLEEVLRRRWYAYEQTLVTLLQAVQTGKRISQFFVGHISDLTDGRESLVSALQQVDRTERVLKSFWQEQNGSRDGWIELYRNLQSQSDHTRRTASVILSNLLEGN